MSRDRVVCMTPEMMVTLLSHVFVLPVGTRCVGVTYDEEEQRILINLRGPTDYMVILPVES